MQVVVLSGVSGSGKTTVGTLLAHRLGVPYAEADDFHPPANVAKMAAGHPLTDEDRAPWLAAISAWIGERLRAGTGGVVTCSALKPAYRDVLRNGHPTEGPDSVRMVYLHITPELAKQRLAGRHGHFFPPALLDSQFEALREPQPGEHVITVDVDASPEQLVETIIGRLKA
ncbi:MAG: gluconokinase [Micromonosporaceae bacterium]|nr:gluconokinase [Micromonosporaceae bacterium]